MERSPITHYNGRPYMGSNRASLFGDLPARYKCMHPVFERPIGGHPESIGENRAEEHLPLFRCQGGVVLCQGKVEMSPSWQSRNVPFCLGLCGVRGILRVPVKRRRALLASNPIKE